ncbi:group I intron-associated PD-(D/E)XK endonuclease [Blastococcus sp. SYSU DS1021]
MAHNRSYSDEQLRHAIANSNSWRGLLRQLGLVATSAGAMRSVRSHADRLGADYSHFTGQRRWTEGELRAAIDAASTWSEVAEHLEVDNVSGIAALKGHAARLKASCEHLTGQPTSEERSIRPDIAHLGRAGSLLAASWFTLCGHEVSWPLEASRYDLLVRTDEGIRRVQVKTTTARAGGTWKVYLSTSRRERRTYDPDEIDDFFIIDGSLVCYLIPVAAVGGLHAIHLRGYMRNTDWRRWIRLPVLDHAFVGRR